MWKLDISASSKVGCVRTNNEDMVLIDEWTVRNGKLHVCFSTDESDRYVIALADGMGGHNSGETASSDVLHNLRFFFHDMPTNLKPSEFNETMVDWLNSINNMIDAKGRSDARFFQMGTTLVSMVYFAGEFYWMNCGDSRLYRQRGGKLQQLTTDHSLSNLMGSHEHSNVITNCIGGGCTTSFIDVVDFTSDIQPGDIYMLCSDGLSDMITDEDIERLLNEGCDADALCCAAEQAGGRDNVSVCVITVDNK